MNIEKDGIVELFESLYYNAALESEEGKSKNKDISNGEFAEIIESGNAYEILSNASYWDTFKNLHFNNISGSKRTVLNEMFEERKSELLNESSTMSAPSSIANGFNVQAFTILTQIYSEPNIGQVMTLFQSSNSKMTFPKMTLKSIVKNFDGSVSEKRFPSNATVTRGKSYTYNIEFNGSNNAKINIFNNFGPGINQATPANSRINRKGFYFTEMLFKIGGVLQPAKKIIVKPNSRNGLNGLVEFILDPKVIDSPKVVCNITGTINWETGALTVTGLFSDKNTDDLINNIELVSLTYTVRFNSKDDPNHLGKEFISLQNQIYEIDVDVLEEFVLKLSVETVQEFRDIWKLDIFRTYAQAVKNQILKNMDADLAELLKQYEPTYQEYGSYSTFDLNIYRDMHAVISPANIFDLFYNIVPKINLVSKNVFVNFNAEPQYIIAGLHAAAILENLQHYKTNFPNQYTGEIGSSNSSGPGFSDKQDIAFRTQKILYSNFIEPNKAYLIYKAPDSDLSRTVIANVIYKAMYITEEMKEGEKLTTIKTRSAIEMLCPEAIGCIEIQNYEDLLGVSILSL